MPEEHDRPPDEDVAYLRGRFGDEEYELRMTPDEAERLMAGEPIVTTGGPEFLDEDGDVVGRVDTTTAQAAKDDAEVQRFREQLDN